MIKEAIDAFLNSIHERVSGFLEPFFAYLYLSEWYVIGLAILAVCIVIGYFFSFTWVRAVLGFIVLLTGAFLAGGQVMFNHLRASKPKPKPPEPKRYDQW